MEPVRDFLLRILTATWEVFVLSSPYVLGGLAVAGLLHVLIRPAQVARWLGRPGMGSMLAAAFLGIPLPLCSCAVVPVTIELSRKGASREASLAFLVSTPETGVDSILLTWGLLGPVMAVCRPLAALATSIVAGLSSMFAARQERGQPPVPAPLPVPLPSPLPDAARDNRPALSRALQYGFVSLAAIPDGFLARVGHGPLAMLVLLVLGVPLYVCASASTPIAAALMLKGVSPGAALVFLLSGPATNASTLVLVARFFGRRFVKIYLGSVVAVALASGLALDALVRAADWRIVPVLSGAADDEHGWLYGAAAGVLALLLVWRSVHGALRRGFADFRDNLRRLAVFPSRGVVDGATGR